jgi:signal transduction histidine kinase
MTARHTVPARESFEWLFGLSAEPLLLVDVAPNLGDSIVLAVNSAALEIHGLEATAVVGMPYHTLVGSSGEDDGLLAAVPGAVVWHRNVHGRSFPVARTVSTVPWDSHQQLIALSPLGIPGQPRASFLHAQRLETLGMVASQVAHDLNNVLVSILTDAALLVDELSPGDPIRERLTAIAIAGRDARALTRQLVGTASSSSERQMLDINALVDDALLLFGAVADPDAAITFETGTDVRPVHVNPVQLRQALLNLLLNANASLKKGPGSIAVATSTIRGAEIPVASLASRESPNPEHSYLAVTVHDTGEGMPPDVLARAFEPFFTTRTDGTGLGLPAVVAAVAAHHGLVGATSTPGAGSTFTVYLPQK